MVKKMRIEGTVLKWGNSFGIRIGKEVVDTLKLNEKEKVDLDIRKKDNPLIELWSSKINISKKRIKELSKELEGEWM